MLWLKSLNNCPPSEFSYVQTEGIHKEFERSPLIGELASRVVDFRKGNGLPRPSRNEVLSDIIVYTVARIGGNLEWCFETDKSPGELLPQSVSSCSSCGASV